MGKTHALVRVAESHALRKVQPWTVVVVDPKREMPRHTRHGVIVSGPRGADEACKRGHRLLIWQGGTGYGDRPDTNAACAWVLQRGAGTLLCLPEAHLALPNGPIPPIETVEVLTGYRHRGLAVILDTQRLVSLSMMARNNLDKARVFGTTGPRDLAELEAWGGVELSTAARECARRRRPPPDGKGEPGWFVDYDPMVSCGPYKLERFK